MPLKHEQDLLQNDNSQRHFSEAELVIRPLLTETPRCMREDLGHHVINRAPRMPPGFEPSQSSVEIALRKMCEKWHEFFWQRRGADSRDSSPFNSDLFAHLGGWDKGRRRVHGAVTPKKLRQYCIGDRTLDQRFRDAKPASHSATPDLLLMRLIIMMGISLWSNFSTVDDVDALQAITETATHHALPRV
jgi:hypothetical protein